MSSAKDTASEQGTGAPGASPQHSRLEKPAQCSPSHSDPTLSQQSPPGGRGGTFVQQCRGQGCEVTKLKGKGVTGSGRLWGAKGPNLLDGITEQFQPPRRDREHQCWWWRAENKTNHRFWGKSLLLPFKPLGKHHTQQSRAGLSSGMREEIFPSPG